MAKVLFVNGVVHGHINPTLPLVKELVSRGDEVCYFSTKEFKEKIEKTGAEFMDYGDQVHQFLAQYRPKGDHPFFTLIEFLLAMDRVIISVVLQRTKDVSFDYMIHDAMFGGGNVLPRKLGLPAVCSCTSFAMSRLPLPEHMLKPGFHPQLDGIYRELEKAAADFGIDVPSLMDIFFKKTGLNLVFTSRMFQPEGESFDDTFKFVGPAIPEREDKEEFPYAQLKGNKVIYISMGTINNNCAGFYQKCMKAFKEEDYKVVMSVGNKVDISSLGRIPPNFIIRNHVPQLEVLKLADAFISHGGLNSVSEALYYKVPVAAIPMANDQPAVAGRLAALGAGMMLKMDEITPQTLKDTVYKLLTDESCRSACNAVGSSLAEAGGYKTAADAVQEFINSRRLYAGGGSDKK
jgi:MGT family glycosyltransferase